MILFLFYPKSIELQKYTILNKSEIPEVKNEQKNSTNAETGGKN